MQHSELLNQAWNKDKLKYRAPNVIALLTRLNHLSYWIPSLVLWQEKQADRARCGGLSFFLSFLFSNYFLPAA